MASSIASPVHARAVGPHPAAPAPLLLVISAALLIALVNPFGYRGGGGDDWHYLEAARCAVARHGLCLPATHWAARFPLVLPMAVAIAVFGEASRVLAGIAMLYSLGAVALFVLLVQRLFGRTEAVIAGLVLVVTPAFSLQLAALDIDSVELFWSLAALLCLQTALARDDRRWALAAGALLGIAVIARTTSLLLVPIGLLAPIAMPRLRRFAPPPSRSGWRRCWRAMRRFMGWRRAIRCATGGWRSATPISRPRRSRRRSARMRARSSIAA